MTSACLKEKTSEYIRYLNSGDEAALKSILFANNESAPEEHPALLFFRKARAGCKKFWFHANRINVNGQQTVIDYDMFCDEDAVHGQHTVYWQDSCISILDDTRTSEEVLSDPPAAKVAFSTLDFALAAKSETAPDSKIVGWGTGTFYHLMKGGYEGQLAYMVDGNPEKEGSEIDGLRVHLPRQLIQEDMDKLVVVVFSSFFSEIVAELKRLGVRTILPAKPEKEKKRAIKFLRQAQLDYPAIETVNYQHTGIVFQGPLHNTMTLPMLARTHIIHPTCKIVLSTWKTSEPELLEKARPLVDELVLLDDVKNPGHRNRNRQSYCTHQGLLALERLGCKFALKMRTDLWCTQLDLLGLLHNTWSNYMLSDGVPGRGRLLVPESFTRVFVPLHPSDMMMFGHMEDMLGYWGTSHDCTLFPIPESNSIWDFSVTGSTPESYYAVQYFQTLYQRLPETFEEALEWFGRHFVVMDDDTLELLWARDLNAGRSTSGPAKLMTNALWRAVAYEGKAGEVAKACDPKATSVKQLREDLNTYTRQDYTIEKKLGLAGFDEERQTANG